MEAPDFYSDKDPIIDLAFDHDTNIISLDLKENFLVTPQNPTFTALVSLIINNISEFEPKFELIEYAENEFVAVFEICDLEVETLKIEISREINSDNMLIVRGNKLSTTTGSKKGKFHAFSGLPPLGGIKYGQFEKLISISGLKDDYFLVKDKDGKTKHSYQDGNLMVFFRKKLKKPPIKGFSKEKK